ncbi:MULTISPECIES: A24 family peptidase [unclassified Variovorax]|uniref:A24 family peptidase n=1 Tax=unclassified Variovorax TaxID=663243 RepID=UPI003ECFF2B9
MQEFHALLELLAMLATDPRVVVLFVLLVVASISDYRTYRIPNWLTFGGAAFALVYKTVIAVSPPSAFLLAFGGLFLGFLMMLPLYVLGAMGAGDVKLMAMVGAFLGVHETLQAVLFAFIVGGIAALGFAFLKGKLARMLRNAKGAAYGIAASAIAGIRPEARIEASQSIGKLPYGICISIGTMGYVLSRQLGYA